MCSDAAASRRPRTDGKRTHSRRLRHCGTLVGGYEPLIIAEHGKVRESSRANEPRLPLIDTTYYHRACYTTVL